MILGIVWDVNSNLIPGWRTPNIYGLLFVTGLIIGYYVVKKMFKEENIPESWLDKLLIYVVVATIVGARLGHVFFYQWEYYQHHLIEIFQIWKGGLASHGAAIGIVIALLLYSKFVSKKSIWWILDKIVVPTAIAGMFIRLGNLFNNEIVGMPTDLPWGFKFMYESPQNLVNGEHVFRHPSQLYEAIGYLASFFILYGLYWKTKIKEKRGFIFGLFLVLIFGWRFIVEYSKIVQTQFDLMVYDATGIDIGQWLSVPFILAGIIIMILANKKRLNRKEKEQEKVPKKS